MIKDKQIIIIAGPNVAGKTTFAREYLPREAGCPVFINADLIAGGLSPFKPESAMIQAEKLMLEQIRKHVRNGTSFSFETTLSGRGYSRLIPQWRAQGYFVQLIYLCLPNEKMAVERVASRVKNGGHDIPRSVIRRRFKAGWRNFNEIYKKIADSWLLFDNSKTLVLLEKGGNQ